MHVYLTQAWRYSLISPETHKQICLDDWARHGRVLGTLNFLLTMFQVKSRFGCRVYWHIFPVLLFHSPRKILVQYFKTVYFYVSTKSPTWTNNYLTDSRSYRTGAKVSTLLIPNKPSDTIHSPASFTAYILNIHLTLLCIFYIFIQISEEASPPKCCKNFYFLKLIYARTIVSIHISVILQY